jgi:hypothetical protein
MVKDQSVYGVGINDADYQTKVYKKVAKDKWAIIWACPFYDRWSAVLERCHPDYKIKRPTYEGCTVDPRWIYFSSFKEWMQGKNWEKLQLDKDLKVLGNKVYGPNTCEFVPSWVNSLVVDNLHRRSDLPLGVNRCDSKMNPYRAQVSQVVNNKNKHLGCFPTPEIAHSMWQLGKAEQIEIALERYKQQDCYLPQIGQSLSYIADKLRSFADEGILYWGHPLRVFPNTYLCAYLR